MRLFTTVAGLRCYLGGIKSQQGQIGKEDAIFASSHPAVEIGFVPTMGALHEGHLSLMRSARQENDVVVVSIFVNPLQFGPNEDFRCYPRTLEQDRQFCEQVGVDVIFAPMATELYGAATGLVNKEEVTQVIPPSSMMAGLCGRFRPGHFQGVATVVVKLLTILQPERAYFGQKDAQQLAIIRQVVADLNLPVEIRACPIVRDVSGLAMSSRNQYLTVVERSQATVLYRSLQRAKQLFHSGNHSSHDLITAVKEEVATVPAVRLQYVELVHPETMVPLARVDEEGLLAIAAYVGPTRLIDNILLRNRKPILAIDGPAGAGKSTVMHQVAQSLGLLYLDTGAMYRAVTWLVLQSGIPIEDEAAVAELVSQCHITIAGQSSDFKITINDQDVTQKIRSLEVTARVSAIAAQPFVRRKLVEQQQEFGRRGGVVMNGRDIGTQVFPDAELKIFLTASVQERARRRQKDLKDQGQLEVSLEALEQAIYARDQKDSSRKTSPLRKAPDAIEIQTDGLTIDEVTAKIVSLYYTKLSENKPMG